MNATATSTATGPTPLAVARIERGLTQELLARLVPCARSYLCIVELGRGRPSRLLAARLSEILGRPVDELFPGGVSTNCRGAPRIVRQRERLMLASAGRTVPAPGDPPQ